MPNYCFSPEHYHIHTKVRVKGFFGDVSVMSAEREDILICTIEKANGLINNFIMRFALQNASLDNMLRYYYVPSICLIHSIKLYLLFYRITDRA